MFMLSNHQGKQRQYLGIQLVNLYICAQRMSVVSNKQEY